MFYILYFIYTKQIKLIFKLIKKKFKKKNYNKENETHVSR